MTPAVLTAGRATATTASYAAARGRRSLLPTAVGGLALLAVAVVASLTVGARTVGPGTVLDVLTGAPADPVVAGLVHARLDRTVIALVVGACVAVCGAVLQGVTRNPLADPGILGLNSGAALAVVLGIQLVGITTVTGYVWFALVGVLLTAVLVQGIALTVPSRSQPLTMALAGAAVMALAQSILGGVLVANRGTLDVFRFWQVGSVAGRPAGIVWGVAPFVVVGLLLCLTSAAVLNANALGDDLARSLGQRVVLQRGSAAVGAVLLAAAATALAGPVGFIGLVVPHAVRLLRGPDNRQVLLGSLIGGPALVLVADTVGRVVSPPSEVQVGIMSAVFGAPVLVLLVRRMGRR